MSVDVVIPTWRGRDLVLGCLAQLERQTVEHTVVVVDNASGDGTPGAVRDRHPEARVLELPENVGFGRAVNAGAALGSGEIIVLVNNDVEVEPRFVEAIVAPFAEARVGMVAGMTLMPEAVELVDGLGIELDATLAAYNRLRWGRADGRAGRLAGPSGGAAAYRRAAWEAAGGFDERLFAYGEDVDLALRLRVAGWRAEEARDARGVHLGGATVGVDSPRQRELAGFARGYLLRRYGILASRAGPRALAFEALTVGWGLTRYRTVVPLSARVRGWRAAAGARRPLPSDAVDKTIGWREELHRLRSAR